MIGEKYYVDYERDNPEVNEVLRNNPIFLNSELTGTTVGKIAIVRESFFPLITYEYKVVDKNYRRSYPFPNFIKEKIEVGQKYEVTYWIKNPQRSRIELDKSIE